MNTYLLEQWLYIAHHLRGNVQENIVRVTFICKEIATMGEVIPLSQIHAFGMSVDGDQIQVMQYCLSLLSKVHELKGGHHGKL